MNLNGIINMIARMMTRRATKWGMKSMDRHLSGGGRKGAAGGGDTPAAAGKARGDLRAASKRARQAARITRRLR